MDRRLPIGRSTALNRRFKVLLVEDDAAFRELVSAALRKSGFSVQAVADGAPALKTLEQAPRGAVEPPDLILTDLDMSPVDGLELLARVGQRLPRLPVVVLTASRDAQLLRRARGLGAAEVLCKPISMAALIAVIGQFSHA